MTIKRWLVVSALTLTSLYAGSASADYACFVHFRPGASVLGNSGFIQLTLYDQPNCTGNFLYTKWYCSEGATDNKCASSSMYRLTSSSAATFAAMLRDAIVDDQQLSISTVTCNGGGAGCLGTVSWGPY